MTDIPTERLSQNVPMPARRQSGVEYAGTASLC